MIVKYIYTLTTGIYDVPLIPCMVNRIISVYLIRTHFKSHCIIHFVAMHDGQNI